MIKRRQFLLGTTGLVAAASAVTSAQVLATTPQEIAAVTNSRQFAAAADRVTLLCVARRALAGARRVFHGDV